MMKKLYVTPSLEVVEIQQQGYILTGSIIDINGGDTGIGYGGGGHVEPTSRMFIDDFDDFDLNILP